MTRSPRVTALLLAPLLLGLTGCGSTALRGRATASGTEGLDPSSVAGGGSSTSGDRGLDASGGVDVGSGAVAPGAGPSAGGALPTAGPTRGGMPGSVVPGVTGTGKSIAGAARDKTPIKLGIVAADTAAIGAVFGVSSSGDPLAGVKRMITYINDNGGAGGRPLAPVFTTIDSGGDANSEQQKACTALTQDDKVDIVAGSGEVLASCLNKHGIAMFDSSVFATDEVQMRSNPNWFLPSAIRADRSAAAILRNAVTRGWLTKSSTLGVIVESCPWAGRAYDGVVVPLAKQLGVKLVKGSVKCLENLVADLVPVTSDVQRETLRFASMGVTDVLSVANTEAFVLSTFTSNASQQNYHPHYLVGSNAYPFQNSAPDATIKISADALPMVRGFGTMPLLDVGALARPATKGQADAQARCTKADPTMFDSAKQKPNAQPFRKNIFFAGCDIYFMIKQVLDANGGSVALTDVAAGYAAVLRSGGASSVLAGGSYAGGAAGQLDGAGKVQPFAWSTERKRFESVGTTVPVP